MRQHFSFSTCWGRRRGHATLPAAFCDSGRLRPSSVLGLSLTLCPLSMLCRSPAGACGPGRHGRLRWRCRTPAGRKVRVSGSGLPSYLIAADSTPLSCSDACIRCSTAALHSPGLTQAVPVPIPHMHLQPARCASCARPWTLRATPRRAGQCCFLCRVSSLLLHTLLRGPSRPGHVELEGLHWRALLVSASQRPCSCIALQPKGAHNLLQSGLRMVQGTGEAGEHSVLQT